MNSMLFVPSILFLVIVAPLWLILHYRYKSQARKGVKDEDLKSIDELLASVDKLSDRIAVLEKILDEKHKGWTSESKGDI